MGEISYEKKKAERKDKSLKYNFLKKVRKEETFPTENNSSLRCFSGSLSNKKRRINCCVNFL